MSKLTTVLDVLGAALLVAGAAVTFGLGLALSAAGVLCVVASWRLVRP